MTDEYDNRARQNIISIEHGTWLDRRQLADRLGIDGPRLDRYIDSDEIEIKQTSKGLRYRYVGPPDSSEDSEQPALRRTEVVAVGLEEWTEAQKALARLEAKLDASNQDVRRAVDYVHELEEECDRLADSAEASKKRLDEVRARLDEERNRRRALEQKYETMTEQLREATSFRARYHLEVGRRQQAQETADQQAEKIESLQHRLKLLTDALEKAEQEGFCAEFGSLKIEWKK